MFYLNSLLKGNVVVHELDSEILKDNPLRDPSRRFLPVYLPSGYGLEKRSLPVVFFLGGLFGRATDWLQVRAFNENAVQLIDVAAQVTPFIGVFPDCFTRFGGSQFINSPASGRYGDYLLREVVPFVDDIYRTNGIRVLVGKSSGGYGALYHLFHNPELFSAAASHSGDSYFEFSLLPEIAHFAAKLRSRGGLREFLAAVPRLSRLGSDEALLLNVVACSAAYSPNPQSEFGFDLPVDPETGALLPEVWARWLEHDPVNFIPRLLSERRNDYQKLRLIYLDAGDQDEYALNVGARMLAQKLRAAGLPVKHDEYSGGHFQLNSRLPSSLAALRPVLETDS